MVALAGLVSTLGLVLVGVLAYAGLCIVLLSFLVVPDESPYHLVEDLVFAVTIPFVLVVLLAAAARSVRR